ncbi:hypothetical protein R3P38DRAFT_2761876 [Favolaschia claudopus]|uniref:FAD-binding PCMH-type domain-containing protein n=1 Tax=Favolaschia claudopus TaxID=2862362 RepID=A0AAW0DMZ6_9AGAR
MQTVLFVALAIGAQHKSETQAVTSLNAVCVTETNTRNDGNGYGWDDNFHEPWRTEYEGYTVQRNDYEPSPPHSQLPQRRAALLEEINALPIRIAENERGAAKRSAFKSAAVYAVVESASRFGRIPPITSTFSLDFINNPIPSRFSDWAKLILNGAEPCFTNVTSPECLSVQRHVRRKLADIPGVNGKYARTPARNVYCSTRLSCSHRPCCAINVRGPEDVIGAFDFSKQTGIPLVVKNTGHDLKGRSSGRNSVALWISYDAAFVAEGTQELPLAGIQFFQAFQFAEEHNIALVVRSDATVGLTGGFIMGGGQYSVSVSIASCLQYKIVTPDGKYRTANACPNEDLFFALRGGGGGTFGVILEATILAGPAAPVQVLVLTWPPTARFQTLRSFPAMSSSISGRPMLILPSKPHDINEQITHLGLPIDPPSPSLSPSSHATSTSMFCFAVLPSQRNLRGAVLSCASARWASTF